MKKKVLGVTKKIIAGMLLMCMMFGIYFEQVSAANEYKYTGINITYNNGSGIYTYEKTWRGGLFFCNNYKDRYYLTNSYSRCLTYYHDEWIANQHQILTVNVSKTKTRSVENGVSAELGVEDAISFNWGSNYLSSVSTNYSTGLDLTFDLSKFKHKSYKIASMGFYDKFKIFRYKNGSCQKSYTAYAYNAKLGQEIRLVYRF